MEKNGTLPFLDVLVTKEGTSLKTTVYRKFTHMGCYLHFQSNHPQQVKRGVTKNLLHRANTMCHDKQNNMTELSLVKRDLLANAYQEKQVKSIINMKPQHRKEKKNGNEVVLTCRVTIPYIQGQSEKFTRTGNMFNIETIFKTRNTIGSILRKLKPKKDLMDKPQCVYRIPCECSRKYTGETSRQLSMRLKEHKYNFRLGHVENLN
jgi:predicted GIY-YIG superfamily endonuclease